MSEGDASLKRGYVSAVSGYINYSRVDEKCYRTEIGT